VINLIISHYIIRHKFVDYSGNIVLALQRIGRLRYIAYSMHLNNNYNTNSLKTDGVNQQFRHDQIM
jgi:hypothetical protein